MKPVNFQYERPADLADALETMRTFAGLARPLSGGQSLVPMLNMRLVQPAVVVDINDLGRELEGFRRRGDELEIGALTRYSRLRSAPEIVEQLPLLAHVIGFVGDRQVRNRGTLGGSISQADPTGEIPLCCVALGATIVVESAARGRRELAAEDFFLGAYTPALEPDEILLAARFPRPPERFAFTEVGRKHNDFALLSVVVAATPTGDRWGDVRVALAGVADRPIAVPEAAALLDGQRWDAERIGAAAEVALAVIDPADDVRASAEYRRHLVPIKLRAAIEELGRVASL